MASLPLILDSEELESRLNTEDLLVVDLCKADTYTQTHIPGAVHLDYPAIVGANKPTMGLLPDANNFSAALSAIGATPDTHIVAYDDEGGGKASRLLWTLDAAGHKNMSLLNGGLHAWANEGHPLDPEKPQVQRSAYPVTFGEGPVADANYILSRLGNDSVSLVDTRSADEYNGVKKLANKAGHIPGAVHFEWTRAMDQGRNLRLKTAQQLTAMLEPLGVIQDKEVIVYCQTHHRSAHTFIVLKSLGFRQLKGYHGGWSDWGNRPDTPVE